MLVLGAGGFAKQIYHTIKENTGKQSVFFYDDVNFENTLFLNQYEVLGSEQEAKHFFETVSPSFILGTGVPKVRKFLDEKFSALGGRLKSLLSTKAQISKYAQIETGTIILPFAIIEPDVIIGRGCIINVKSLVSHDSTVGNYCEISPGTIILGHCTIGANVQIGAGAIILPGITIGEDAIIGAGAVVTKNVPASITVMGIPAKS